MEEEKNQYYNVQKEFNQLFVDFNNEKHQFQADKSILQNKIFYLQNQNQTVNQKNDKLIQQNDFQREIQILKKDNLNTIEKFKMKEK